MNTRKSSVQSVRQQRSRQCGASLVEYVLLVTFAMITIQAVSGIAVSPFERATLALNSVSVGPMALRGGVGGNNGGGNLSAGGGTTGSFGPLGRGGDNEGDGGLGGGTTGASGRPAGGPCTTGGGLSSPSNGGQCFEPGAGAPGIGLPPQ